MQISRELTWSVFSSTYMLWSFRINELRWPMMRLIDIFWIADNLCFKISFYNGFSVLEEDAFILTTDADVKFSPDSVEALLDLMTRDTSVGAVCARTYPQGNGPLIWYQEFEYAIGHWLQKVIFVYWSACTRHGEWRVLYMSDRVRKCVPVYKKIRFKISDYGI